MFVYKLYYEEKVFFFQDVIFVKMYEIVKIQMHF